MTLRATFVQARHGEAPAAFHGVMSVRIMAIHAVHVAFNDGMMLGKIKFGMDVDVALEARARILAGIDDETSAAAADADVSAGGAVAGFAAAHLGEFDVVLVETAMRAVREGARDISVTFHASRVADKMRARNVGRRDDGAIERCARQK